MNSPSAFRHWWSVLLLTAAAAASSCMVPASQDPENNPGPAAQPPSSDSVSPPGRVGRLDLIDGVVSFRPAQGDTWAVAGINQPVTTGDRLWVDSIGHAEVEIGQDAVRLSRETEVDIERLDDDALQLRLPQGSTIVRVAAVGVGQDYEIDAPNASIALTQAGSYRVDVSTDGATTTVTVRDSGEAEVTATGQSFTVRTNQTATVQGDSAPTYNVAAVTAPDDFDQWSTQRDQREDEATASAAKYVSPEMGGVADLSSGQWDDVPDYGAVWYPPVAVGWAPYRFGHWVWIDPWGWTWIEDEPWGWAPFHYGRWAYFGARWGWCPGPAPFIGVYSPFYAPALIGWIGGPGWAVGVGWFPLGPREPFVPWYHAGYAYRDRVNVYSLSHIGLNTANVSYRYRGVADAVTVVPHGDFANGSPVSRVAVHLTPEQLQSAPISREPGVVPTERSLPGFGETGRAARSAPPARLASRTVVASHAPPPAPVPLSAQRQMLANNGGRPLVPSQLSTLRASNPAARASAFPVRSAVTTRGGGGLSPARPGLPATHPVTGPASFSRGGAAPRSTLDQEYMNERTQMETRHQQEFAQPRAEPEQRQMFERQQAEHNDLSQRYNMARQQNMSHLPPSRGFGGGFHGGGGRPR
jgi:hypothetical protein